MRLKALPERAILTKDARQTLNSAASMFTLYLASIAHETSVANKRSTITLKDVLQTLRDADFEHFIEPIEACLQEAKDAASRKKSQKAAAGEEEGGETTTEVVEQLEEVALDTNDEDPEEDEAMMSVEEPSDNEEVGDAEEDTEAKGAVDDDMQDETKIEQDRPARERKTEDENDDLMEQ
ncbi:DNA polymerase epsilon subunit 3 [Phytophthora citrophthora]|uniref:DNA polymerase epsilon subunit 3 n=1 Tax=Phytophthora citrophthora TaxID=4793 RepID=A0AAD9G625_9STRA|nr:DNA polymerase epsilon subunit 3 [Phytophthora citrophthora]